MADAVSKQSCVCVCLCVLQGGLNLPERGYQDLAHKERDEPRACVIHELRQSVSEDSSKVNKSQRVLVLVCQDYGLSQTVFEDCNVMAGLGDLFS